MIQGVLIAAKLGKLDAPVKAYEATDENSAAAVVEKIISIGLGGVTIIAGLYFLLVLVVSAFNWLSASGDTGKVKKARDGIIQGLIGLIILISSYAILGLLSSVFGIRLLNPGAALLELAP